MFGKENLRFTWHISGPLYWMLAYQRILVHRLLAVCVFFCICSSAYINRICPAVDIGLAVPRGYLFWVQTGPCPLIGLLVDRRRPPRTLFVYRFIDSSARAGYNRPCNHAALCSWAALLYFQLAVECQWDSPTITRKATPPSPKLHTWIPPSMSCL